MILKQFLGLSHKLRPTVISSRMEKRKALLTENADQKKRLPDNLQKKLDETFLNMQLYEKALKLFEHDQSTSELTSQVSAETDPVSFCQKLCHYFISRLLWLLPHPLSLSEAYHLLIVFFHLLQFYHKAIQAPGRVISVSISQLKDKRDESADKVLTDYQAATVTLSAIISW
ncbi:E3 UFM1-protein ligase 1 homolog isoform X1 [Arachis stenosperma]|uniref:E3 UFM1-protein ligase 1 homolog isoform X1 n=1 Tax=Arachis stenosperma TaxID=217475 RepID=UPI0025AD2DB9|nr:E3 UFM1-protein ligase 1 homolog isoform X1 [Arachis stenosperma]XP_057720638.1 E3 UFM1-protein ligase 1 homolog isoform X1 [Arachis stenosperma]XP_057720639.1 E3 UFM1-protein ligase 1 homolog isoform X1 [Arachis stenosperma]XP_057720640.1 E3 UFM1-protein ligase 1 homolog isoform X1 [Arachis stenosperma]XP_057720641.1 E3 UFM1-protein ligase 1 homolog isoform X1 [Arachis stenosperma]